MKLLFWMMVVQVLRIYEAGAAHLYSPRLMVGLPGQIIFNLPIGKTAA